MSPTPAIAVFVKTPGASPVKTRLAASIGNSKAKEFYQLSLNAVEDTLDQLLASEAVRPYWAIAEDQARSDTRWQRHQRVLQGPGELGRRIAHVFGALLEEHNTVLAIGGDSPQITPQMLIDAIEHLKRSVGPAHVIGRCHDGGFYLVGANYLLPLGLWEEVTYSTESTADKLTARLALHGPVYEMPPLCDVDRVDDLMTLRNELRNLGHSSKSQQALLHWLEQIAKE